MGFSNELISSSETQAKSPLKCRYRLTNDTSASFTLPDGRKLGYAQYGSPNGRAILYIHGLPGSRIEAAMFEELAFKLDARIISADRPGVGWSSPHPERSILDFAKDMEHLTEHLGLEQYGILGLSGGGPYALACAVSMPADKLKCVSLVCGLGPPDIGTSGMRWPNWLGFIVGYRYFPALVRWWFKRQAAARLDLSDEKRLELAKREFARSKPHEKDVEVMKDEDLFRLFLRTARETFAQGFEGFLQDGRLDCMDFGFRVEDIRPDLPVRLWYGKLDTNVPLNHGEQIAVRLAGRAQLRVEDETHLSLEVNCMWRFLKDLVENI